MMSTSRTTEQIRIMPGAPNSLSAEESDLRPKLRAGESIYVAAAPTSSRSLKAGDADFLYICPLIASAFVEYAGTMQIATECTDLQTALLDAAERECAYLIRPRFIADEDVSDSGRFRLTRLLIDILYVPTGAPVDSRIISKISVRDIVNREHVLEVLAEPLADYVAGFYL